MSEEEQSFLDWLEDKVEASGYERGLRERFEKNADRVPVGPLNKTGDGQLVGLAGYAAISTGQTAVLPVPGVRQPGYNVISHGSEVFPKYVRHTVRINAASKNVAEFAAKYGVSAPSNLDYLTSEIETVSIEEVKKRPTFSTWEIVVDVADRGEKEV